MNQKMMWGVAIVVVLILIGWMLSSRTTSTPTPTTEDVATTTMGSMSAMTDGTYMLSTEKSMLTWTGSKAVIKNYSDSGTLAFSDGSVTVTGGALVAGSFTIDMKSLKGLSTGSGSGQEALSEHLKSADFFDVAHYPVAVIGVKGVTKDGIVTADITIKGVTKEVSFPATIVQEGKMLSANASLTIDRTLWDLRYGSGKFFSDLGDKVISDLVSIDLKLVAEMR
jgi:polyisoprenoid-binding protein YceI